MKNLKLFLLGLMLCAALPSQAWDRTRHDAIAYIAECNLTPRAKRNIARYLDHSIVYYASWMDKYRDTPEFRNVEHVSYVDAGMQLVDTLRKGKTNCVVELMRAVDRLKDYRNMSDSLVRLNLMYVIHIVGDMHCPSHVKYAGCKSGRADLNGRKMSYHAMWDWGVLDGAHGWSYSEYQQLLDTFSKREKAAMAKGTPREWLHETAVACRVIYDWQRADETYGQAVRAGHLPAARKPVDQGLVPPGCGAQRIVRLVGGPPGTKNSRESRDCLLPSEVALLKLLTQT